MSIEENLDQLIPRKLDDIIKGIATKLNCGLQPRLNSMP